MPWRTLSLLLAGQLMASMDGSILTVAMPVLQHELHASPTMLQAIFAGYTFAFGVLVVTGARLGDDRGHGRMFTAGRPASRRPRCCAGSRRARGSCSPGACSRARARR